MIKATAGNLVLLGLSNENVKRLKEGKPIHIYGAELGIERDIVIVWGKTEKEILKSLKPMISAQTIVRDSDEIH